MTERERTEIFADEISGRCKLLRAVERWQGTNSVQAAVLRNAVIILTRLFEKMYGEDAIDEYFEPEEKDVFGIRKNYKLKGREDHEERDAGTCKQTGVYGAGCKGAFAWKGA